MTKEVCKDCPEFQKVAENMGYCKKFKFQMWMSLAKTDRVCEGME